MLFKKGIVKLNRSSYIMVTITLLLSLWALADVVSTYIKSGVVNPAYLVFVSIGLLGAVVSYFNVNYGKWLVFTFYCLQVVFIYGEHMRFVFHPGIVLSINLLDGSVEKMMPKPRGFGINVLGIFLLVLSVIFVRKNDENKDPECQI